LAPVARSCADRTAATRRTTEAGTAGQLELEPDVDGKRRTVRRGGFATKKDAQAWLDEANGKAARGADVTRKITVGVYLAEWLAGKRNLRETTRRSYQQHITDYLVPHLGRIELGALRRSHVEAMLDALEMGPATRQRVRATLRSVLHDAEREGLVIMNAARLARLESGRRPQVHPLEPAELERLLDRLAAASGVRCTN
jgi:integrase